MSKKRVLLGNDSRLLRELLQRVIDKADQLEVVQEFPGHAELPSAIERLEPDWVILSPALNKYASERLGSCAKEYPTMRFIFVSPEEHTVTLKSRTSYEENLTALSLKDFLTLLQTDVQPAGAKKEES